MGRALASFRVVGVSLSVVCLGQSAFAQGGFSLDTTKNVAICPANGDVNNDGFLDFLMSDYLFSSQGFNARGKVEMRSGKDGAVLYTVLGTGADVNFGSAIASVGDINLDGFPDWVAGEPGYGYDALSGTYLGQIRAISGKNGADLYSTGDTAAGKLGSSLANVGDVDHDGAADFAAGAPSGGFVNVYSTRTGARIKKLTLAATNYDGFGARVFGVGDVNKDGHPDVMVGWPTAATVQGNQSGIAVVFGASPLINGYWPLLHQIDGQVSGAQLGMIGAAAGDWNADGYADFALGAGNENQGATPLRIYSGKDGLVLLSLSGAVGTSLAALGDLNNDAVEDFALGNATDQNPGPSAGSVIVFSGKTGQIFNIYLGSANVGLGARVARMGDANNDGSKDLLVAGSSALTGNGVVKMIYQLLGVTAYGTGSPGCLGKQTLSANGSAKIGTPGFRLTVTAAPTFSVAGNLLIGSSPSFSGANPFGLVLPLYVDLAASGELYVVPMSTSSSSASSVTIPIPNDPALFGRTYYSQVLWAWPTSQCTTPATANLSASNGLSFLIL